MERELSVCFQKVLYNIYMTVFSFEIKKKQNMPKLSNLPIKLFFIIPDLHTLGNVVLSLDVEAKVTGFPVTKSFCYKESIVRLCKYL